MYDLYFESIRQINLLSICIRFFLALVCGGLIGLERGRKGRAAGFRTHILVCIGSCMTMMTGQYAHQFLVAGTDPTRIGAQVISGIGFLGAGTIIITAPNKVKGLTTAAGLWTSACIGLAIGIGFYEAALIGTIFVLLAITVLHKWDDFFYSRSQIITIYVEVTGNSNIPDLTSNIRQHGLRIISFDMQKSGPEESGIGIALTIQKGRNADRSEVLSIIGETPGLIFLEEIF